MPVINHAGYAPLARQSSTTLTESNQRKTSAASESLFAQAISTQLPLDSDDDYCIEQLTNIDNGNMDDEFSAIESIISEIGMGAYQWKLFWLCGMGWVADNMWLQGIASTLPKFQRDFDLSDSVAGLGITAALIGMIFGSAGWGVCSDVIGRMPAFNLTLLMAGVCGIVSAFAPSFSILCITFFSLALGVGGNLPVDGTLFLEFTPKKNQSLLTLMSIFWPVGQILVSIVAILFIPSHSCPDFGPCDPASNRGWRILLFIIGTITLFMVAGRLIFFRMLESPKFLLAAGRRDEAIDVLYQLAHENGVTITIDPDRFSVQSSAPVSRRKSDLGWSKLKPLFSKDTRKTTVLIWLIWSLVSMGYIMFNGFLTKFLKFHGGKIPLSDTETYRNYVIISIFGVPGSIIGMYAVDTQLGRIGTMSLATLGTSISLCLLTVFTSSNSQMIISCIESLLQNVMYGVIYSYTPEVFRTESRV
ncbi:transporter, variant 2 [Batrachochytrium dendrobatidis]